MATKREILEFIARRSGKECSTTFEDVAENFDLHPLTVRDHLKRLWRERLIRALPSNTGRSGNDLRTAWAEFLSGYRWEWIGTFTFRKGAVHPESADKRFRLLVSMANRALHGPRWAKKGVGISWARGLERQRRGTLHYHALLSGTGELRRLTYMDIWNRLAGFARIERPRSQQSVMRYISKYVVKGGEIDLGGPWFHGVNQGPRLPFDP